MLSIDKSVRSAGGFQINRFLSAPPCKPLVVALGNLFWMVGDVQGGRRETGVAKKAVTSWVLEDLQDSGQ